MRSQSRVQLSTHTVHCAGRASRCDGASGWLPPSGYRLWGGKGKPPGTRRAAERPPSRAPGSPGAGVGTATRRAVPAGTFSLCGELQRWGI